MNDKDEMQTRAETAPKTRRSKEPLESIIARAYRQDGIGLTAGEVLKLTDVAREWADEYGTPNTIKP